MPLHSVTQVPKGTYSKQPADSQIKIWSHHRHAIKQFQTQANSSHAAWWSLNTGMTWKWCPNTNNGNRQDCHHILIITPQQIDSTSPGKVSRQGSKQILQTYQIGFFRMSSMYPCAKIWIADEHILFLLWTRNDVYCPFLTIHLHD